MYFLRNDSTIVHLILNHTTLSLKVFAIFWRGVNATYRRIPTVKNENFSYSTYENRMYN